jgi:CDP-glycerol glycerophosphotransferase
LLTHFPGKYEIIWAFKKPEKYEEILPKGVKAVRYRSLQYYYLAKTCRVLVFNVQGYGELSRRKNQTFIQTWHASNGYKKVGSYLEGMRKKVNLLGHKDYSVVLAGCRNMEQQRVHGSMNFHGTVIHGTPRMDVLINQDHPEIRDKVFQSLGITKQKKILLYAPTWRDNRDQNDYGLSYEILHDALQSRFGGEWIIAVRLHPNVYTKVQSDLPYVLDATSYPDMQELLYVSDALISDYSSCIWDFSFTGRPCFLFCSDLEEYDDKRSFDLPIALWGFPLCKTMQELQTAIKYFDEKAFQTQMDEHHKQMGSYEDGRATERVCALISSLCSNSN